MSQTRALIIGINGQDGSYLADYLLARGYEVHGIHRRTSTDNLRRIAHLAGRVRLHRGDLCDTQSIARTILSVIPDEIYNLADQDDVGWSYGTAGYSYDVTGAAVGRLLEALRCEIAEAIGAIRFFQPISATIFGNSPAPQNESTPLNPLSPYACAKAFTLHLCRFYRDVYGMPVSTAILFNHDSPRREENYLLNKIGRSMARIKLGLQETLELSNLDLRVDVGFAGDYVEAMHAITNHPEPDDFVIGSMQPMTIRELAMTAFERSAIDPAGRLVEIVSDRVVSPTEMIGDCSKAERELHWRGGRGPLHALPLIQADEMRKHRSGVR